MNLENEPSLRPFDSVYLGYFYIFSVSMNNSWSVLYIQLLVICLALVICPFTDFFFYPQCINMKDYEIMILVVKWSLDFFFNNKDFTFYYVGLPAWLEKRQLKKKRGNKKETSLHLWGCNKFKRVCFLDEPSILFYPCMICVNLKYK